MDLSSGLIWGLDFDGPSGQVKFWPSLDLAGIEPGGFRWLHLSLADQRSRHWIESAADLPASTRELLLGKDNHQSALVERGFVCCVLQDFERDFDTGDTQRIGSFRFLLAADFIITARHHPVRTPDMVRAKIAGGTRVTGAPAALHLLVESMIETQTAAIRDLNIVMQAAEDDLIDEGRSPDPRAMAGVRRRTVQFHRLLDGMRAVFQRLERDEDLPEPLLTPVERIVQRIAGLDADVVAVQAQLRLVREEMDSQATQRTNQNLYVLSVMTALMLPATFVTGIFGMNTGGLPWADSPAGTLWAGVAALASAFGIWVLLRLMGLARR
jgi:Mg2+ and Co2+ transporter CorA